MSSIPDHCRFYQGIEHFPDFIPFFYLFDSGSNTRAQLIVFERWKSQMHPSVKVKKYTRVHLN